jgi:predicted anti-sigma-YlaC factor YlaD
MHITEADTLLFLEKKFSRDERARVETHFADCAACASQLAAIARLKRELPRIAAPQISNKAVRQAEQIVKSESSRNRGWWWLRVPRLRIAFGGLAVLAAGVVVLLLPDSREVSHYRDATHFSSTQLLDPADGSNVQPHTVFRWRAAQNAVGYRITLHDHVGLTKWETVSSETTITLASQLELTRGERYFWRVESLFPDQSSQRSQLNAFIYAP